MKMGRLVEEYVQQVICRRNDFATARFRRALTYGGTTMISSWIGLAFDMALLALESQRVVGLRIARIASGGRAAQTELARMLTEKPTALAEAAAAVMTGGSANAIVRRYRTHVKTNQRRLIHGKV